MKLNIDLETRSEVDLRKTGVYPYAADPTTDIWCVSWAVGDEEPDLWYGPWTCLGDTDENMEALHRFELALEGYRFGGPVHAWNAQFERIIWREIMVKRYGFPEIPLEQWYDTAAEAAALALPRSLDGAARALGLDVQKDTEGRKLMLQMAKPRRKKGEQWWDLPEKLERLGAYCRQDVVVERAVGKRTRPLSADERAVYLLDQKANDRGVLVDLDLVAAAQDLASQATDEANRELARITDGEATAVTKVADITRWVRAQGVELPNLRKDTVRDMLKRDDLPENVHRVLQLRADVGKSSVAKLDAMVRATGDDGYARGLLLYHGASTGRWAGKLIQPQNFPRPEIYDIEDLIPDVLNREYEGLAARHPVMEVLMSMLRSMLKASPGHRLVAGDFSQIEARVLAWIAGQEDLVELFRQGGKIYETMASFIFGIPVEEIAKDSFERQIGKNSVLGCGFQMGADRFAEQVWEQTGIVLDRGRKQVNYHCTRCKSWVTKNREDPPPPGKRCRKCWLRDRVKVTDFFVKVVRDGEDMANKAVQGYRTLYSKIPEFWYAINDTAIAAVMDPGSVRTVGEVDAPIKYTYRGRFLWCILPSGRPLAYALPEIRERRLPEPYEHIIKPSLSYVGVDSFTRKWRRQFTYGGHLTENVVQAMARDLMAGAMLRLERAGYPVILTVHDEVITDTPEGHGSVKEFERIMTQLPRWARGLPVAAEAWEGERYRK